MVYPSPAGHDAEESGEGRMRRYVLVGGVGHIAKLLWGYYRGLVGGFGFGTPVVSYAPRPMFIVAGVTLMIIEAWVCLGAY